MRPLALVLFAAVALASVAPRDVSACGGFFRRRTTTKTVPSLQVEQVLILHDPATKQEHFIRELTFNDAKEPFGFVVPTPSQPTVAKVNASPFATLTTAYPPTPDFHGLLSASAGAGSGVQGGGKGGPPPKVTVLSQTRVGSFTAFVLAANDSGALKAWLDKNDLATTPESDAWLAHYVALNFYYVAFRYEVGGTDAGAEKTKSETVRISFASPLPFYPYREPDHVVDAGAIFPPARVLTVWLMTPERYVPVALHEGKWQRPWAEPEKHQPAKLAVLSSQIGELGTLLPRGDAWTVQTFEDQKTSRRGWGDVVLVPDAPREVDASKLATSLDPMGGKP